MAAVSRDNRQEQVTSPDTTRLHIVRRLCVLAAVLLGLTSIAACFGSKPRSRLYEPLSGREAAQLREANRELYPDDIRGGETDLTDITIAWPGILRDLTYQDYGEFVEAVLTVEHRYFLWTEDLGPQPEPYFLSPRGEGMFRTTWRLTPEALRNRREMFGNEGIGNMVIVYGSPTLLNTGELLVEAGYIREIDDDRYRTDVLDYGRSGEPVTILKDLE
ncbi:hypothetical protein GF420_06090 [candidate division GN15 bacterium]|nr:hypothetical protein [candidate division GN15 bacterium]